MGVFSLFCLCVVAQVVASDSPGQHVTGCGCTTTTTCSPTQEEGCSAVARMGKQGPKGPKGDKGEPSSSSEETITAMQQKLKGIEGEFAVFRATMKNFEAQISSRRGLPTAASSADLPMSGMLSNGNHGAETHILFGRRTGLSLLTLSTKSDFIGYKVFPVVTPKVVALDFDPVEKYVYWSSDSAIRRVNETGKVGQTVISDISQECDGLAVDWVARNLYWSDRPNHVIEVSRLDGRWRKTLISTNIESPRAIVLHPAEGKMYWSDWGSSPKIESTSLNGEDRRILVNTGIMWPNAIAIDIDRRTLYWADSLLNKIESLRFDGSARKVLAEFRHHIFGIVYLDQYLYWTDWQTGTLNKMNVDNLVRETVFHGGVRDVMDITAYKDESPTQTNGCAALNGGCSHLCLYASQGPTCYCQDGYALNSDAKTCRRAR